MSTSENVREQIKKITTILQLFCPGKRVIVTNQYPYLLAITGIEPIGLFHHLPRLTKQNHNKLPNSFITSFILKLYQQTYPELCHKWDFPNSLYCKTFLKNTHVQSFQMHITQL